MFPLLCALLISFPLGLVIRGLYPDFQYSTVLPLALATWLAALLSLRTAKIGMPKNRITTDPTSRGIFHAYLGLGEDQHYSQSELGHFFDAISATTLAPTASTEANSLLGIEVRAILMSCSEQHLSPQAAAAFPDAYRLVGEISKKWNDGTIKLHLVSMQRHLPQEANLRALSCFTSNGSLHILVNMPDEGNSKGRPFAANNYQFIAEIMLHAGAEFLVDMPHESSVLAESLPACRNIGGHEKYKVSESVRREIARDDSPQMRAEAILSAKKELLQQSCFGVDCELGWDQLPGEIRSILFSRCLGESYDLTATNSAWLKRNLLKGVNIDLPTYIAQCDFGILLAVNKLRFFKSIKPDESLEKLVGLARRNMHSPDSEDFHFDTEPASYKKYVTGPLLGLYHGLGVWLKFFVVSLTADPEFHRELKFTLAARSRLVSNVATFLISAIWISAKTSQNLILPWFLVGFLFIDMLPHADG